MFPTVSDCGKAPGIGLAQYRRIGHNPPVTFSPGFQGNPGVRFLRRIKAGGRLRAPRPATPPRRAGRGFSIGGRNFNFLLWQMVVVRKFREEIAWFQHPTRWLSQVVFRNFAGVSAGVIFHPLGSTWGSGFPLSLQPPQNRRISAGICARICEDKSRDPREQKC